MYRLRLPACVLVSTLAGVCHAEELASGLYSMSWDGPGRVVNRADTEGQVVLGKQLSPQVRDVTLVSESNDNSRFRLLLVAGPIPEDSDKQALAVVIAGLCVPVASHSDRRADGSISVGTTVEGQDAANRIAAERSIKPRLRTHPGHRLLVTFKPQKSSYHLGDSVTLVMTIKNVGETVIRFKDGGSQRGPRNNQFGFTAYHNYGQGRALPDIGDPSNGGGMASWVKLSPSEVFSKSVNLADWFKFDTPGTYQVTGFYRLTLEDEGGDKLLWDDVALATCAVRVISPEKKTESGPASP